MTISEEELVDYVTLVDFIADNVETDEARSLARRIGVDSKTKYPPEPTGKQLWQAILEAALKNKCSERFVCEVRKLVGESDRANFEQAMRACRVAQYQTIVRHRNPDLYSVSGQLTSARTLGELGEAGKACRELVLRILSAVEVGSAERSILIAASNTADVDKLAERIGTHALNLLATIDRLLDLTEGNEEHGGVQLHAPQHPDDFGPFEGAAPPDPQLLTLARNARSAAWAHLQRVLILLIRNTVMLDPPL